MTEPTVSAVITAYNGERYLAEAIESVLAQTHLPTEVIVVDNASTDRSAEIAAGYGAPVSVHPEPQQGVCFARNTGISVAGGDYLGFLDHDDTWEPHKTELQLDAFRRDPGLDMVFGHARQQVSSDLGADRAARLRLPSGPQPGLLLGSMLAPRSTWQRVGPWQRNWDSADGLAWLVRARGLGLREAMLPETVVLRRLHNGNRSHDNHDSRGEWAVLLKASLDERRAKGA